MADIDWNDVAVFVRVVERGGFARAARELSVPTSTISRSIARLEQSLGTRLLHRSPRSVRVTPDGQEFFAEVSPGVTELRDAVRRTSSKGKPSGVLRVTAANDVGSAVLSDLIVEFTRSYPQLRVEIELTNRKVNLIEEGFDVAVRAALKLESSSLIARRITGLEQYLFAAPAFVERRGVPQVLSDLKKQPCVLFRPQEGRATWTLRGPNEDETVVVEGQIGCDDFSFVRSAVLAGAGIGLIPRVLCDRDVAAGRLVRVLAPYHMAGAALYLLYPSARQLPARVAAFRDFLLQRLAR